MKKPENFYLKINLRYFDEGEKTEKATPKKKKKAREEGQVAKSPEVNTAFLLITAFFGLQFFAPHMAGGISNVFVYSFGLIANIHNIYDLDFMPRLIAYMFMQVVLLALPLMLVSLAVGVVANVLQVGWHPTMKPLMPKLSKLNPIKGFKRVFSMRALVELVKSLIKFAIILIVIYSVVQSEIENIPFLMEINVVGSAAFVGGLIIRLGTTIGIIFLFVALFDYSYQRYKHTKELRMSKHEIKEEYKQSDGNPQIKGKIKQKMREISMRRMMQGVPNADVIITNPTHYAVALAYDRNSGEAPRVVAKGVDFLARRIREKAKENKIEIVENVQLARTLYQTVDVGHEIPPELFQAVAEVLAFVYKLKNKV